MRRIVYLIHFLFLITTAKAEEHYCWSISGLHIRDTPSPGGNIVGKLAYGQKVDINRKDQSDYYYYEDLFLIGIKEDQSADVKFTGSWFKIELGGKIGYVFSGYLSRYPHYLIEEKDNYFHCESFKEYMSRNYTLLNYNESIWDANICDNKVRSYSWDHGVTVINDHNEKGAALSLIFADMTFNEALLFVKFYFQLLESNNSVHRDKLVSSEHYYGLSVSSESCEINFPAPDGEINILKLGQSIIITYHGSC